MQKLNPNEHHSGWWQPSRGLPDTSEQALGAAILRVNRPLFIVNFNGKMAFAQDGTITIGDNKPIGSDALPLMGYVPALHPKDLGDPGFKQAINFVMHTWPAPWQMGLLPLKWWKKPAATV